MRTYSFGSRGPLPMVQFRGYFSVVEKLERDSNFNENESCLRSSFTFMNATMGWDLGGGWDFNRECFRKAFVETCGLDPGEVYVVMPITGTCTALTPISSGATR